MSVVTRNVSEYVRKKGINLSELSRSTKIQYRAIYDSLAKPERDRDLRDHELIKTLITNIVKRIYREIKNAEELENQRKELEEKSEKRNREVKASVWLVESKARSNKEWTKIYIDKKHKKIAALAGTSTTIGVICLILLKFYIHQARSFSLRLALLEGKVL